jgi:hypothetical protein
MKRKLTPGDMYRTIKGSIVTYLGKVDSERSRSGWCHKFRTLRSKTKYIQPEEIDKYLGDEDDET